MKLGANSSKIAVLAGLLAVLGYLLLSPSSEAPPTKTTRPLARPEIPREVANGSRASSRRITGNTQEWVPTLKPRRIEDRPDPGAVDPTLRIDVLAKLQNVTIEGGHRSLFDFSAASVSSMPEPRIIPGKKTAGSAKAGAVSDIKPGETKPIEASKPSPPPIPFKFYGFIATRDGKRAFFLSGDDIFAVAEGGTIQSRYKIIRIGLNSAILEDTQFKHQQTIPMEEPPPNT